MTPLPHRRYPCTECPWRRDTAPGQFTTCRYQALRVTTGTPGREADLRAPMFACHKSPEGAEEACAGWLAAVGIEHLGVRFAVALGRLPAEVLRASEDWPELHVSYEEMVTDKAG